MSWLDTLTPTNLTEEKQKFFADQTYQPHFVYAEPVTTEMLQQYGLPKKPLLDLAQEIVDRTFFGRNEADLTMMEGPTLSQAEVTRRCTAFLDMHHLKNRFQILWSPTFVSRATMTSEFLKLRTDSVFTTEGLLGMM